MDLFKHWVIRPFAQFGLTHSFFDIHADVLIYTWVAMGILCIMAAVAYYFARTRTLNVYTALLEKAMLFFSDLCSESIGFFRYDIFVFMCSIFFFTLMCNLVGLLPFIEESTKDLNTTIALGLSVFFYVQYKHIQAVGIVEYLKDYTRPIILLLPLEIVGKIASVISMSFRLFGNIFGGAVVFMMILNVLEPYRHYFVVSAVIILAAYYFISRMTNFLDYMWVRHLVHLCVGVVFLLSGVQMFFGIFEGFVQAFVLTMLTATYLSTALAPGGEEL